MKGQFGCHIRISNAKPMRIALNFKRELFWGGEGPSSVNSRTIPEEKIVTEDTSLLETCIIEMP